MTKLLTALLIAGLSVTAKAEPTVYYCERVGASEIWGDGRTNAFEGGRFTLAIKDKSVTISRRLGEETLKSTFVLDSAYDPAINTFRSTKETTPVTPRNALLNFNEKVLTYSSHAPGVLITSWVAVCEDF